MQYQNLGLEDIRALGKSKVDAVAEIKQEEIEALAKQVCEFLPSAVHSYVKVTLAPPMDSIFSLSFFGGYGSEESAPKQMKLYVEIQAPESVPIRMYGWEEISGRWVCDDPAYRVGSSFYTYANDLKDLAEALAIANKAHLEAEANRIKYEAEQKAKEPKGYKGLMLRLGLKLEKWGRKLQYKATRTPESASYYDEDDD